MIKTFTASTILCQENLEEVVLPAMCNSYKGKV